MMKASDDNVPTAKLSLSTIDLPSKQDVESSTLVKLSFPKRIAFIVSIEFCERFMYYGIRSILVLYLTRKLFWDNDTATVTYHAWASLSYFLSLFGAIISDSFIGKFKTIFYLSIVYALGSCVIALGAIPQFNLPVELMTIFGLVLVAFGTGGIKPCVCAFSGEQFKLPEQTAQVALFFSLFYFIIYIGSLTSTIVTPIIRQDLNCFGKDDCFSLAFGLPGILIVICLILYVSVKSLYTIKPPSGNMAVLVSKCIGHGFSRNIKEKKSNPKNHWLDYSVERYGQQLVDDTKILLKILLLYIPLPLFWALYDQQGSRWTIQATRMSGELGSIVIKPDQMQVINPLLVLIFIPLFDVFVYPILSKIGIRRPLQKMVIGGILGATSFLLSGIVELQLEKTYPIVPGSGQSQLRIFNTFPCNYSFFTNIPGHENFELNSMETFVEKNISVVTNQSFAYCASSNDCQKIEGNFNLRPETAISYFGQRDSLKEYEDHPQKSLTGDPMVRILLNSQVERRIKIVDISSLEQIVRYENTSNFTGLITLLPSYYDIYVEDIKVTHAKLAQGAVFTILILEKYGLSFNSSVYEMASPNSMHMFWLIPQFTVVTLGEVMFSVTGLHFSFAQAPESMKSVIQSCWLMTIAFGNLIDVIVVGAQIFDSQANEFFLFAGVMFIDMGLFIILAWAYKSSLPEATENEKENNSVHMKNLEGIGNEAFKED